MSADFTPVPRRRGAVQIDLLWEVPRVLRLQTNVSISVLAVAASLAGAAAIVYASVVATRPVGDAAAPSGPVALRADRA